jgi:hypothetical protein
MDRLRLVFVFEQDRHDRLCLIAETTDDGPRVASRPSSILSSERPTYFKHSVVARERNRSEIQTTSRLIGKPIWQSLPKPHYDSRQVATTEVKARVRIKNLLTRLVQNIVDCLDHGSWLVEGDIVRRIPNDSVFSDR